MEALQQSMFLRPLRCRLSCVVPHSFLYLGFLSFVEQNKQKRSIRSIEQNEMKRTGLSGRVRLRALEVRYSFLDVFA